MKLTKTNLTIYKQDHKSSGLICDVINYILDRWNDYERKENIFREVLHWGCSSGIVSHLIYYDETIAYYNKHKEEINTILYESLNEIGDNNPKSLFGGNWNEQDPLALDTSNQNLLAWYGFEETMHRLAYEFDIEY